MINIFLGLLNFLACVSLYDKAKRNIIAGILFWLNLTIGVISVIVGITKL